MLSFLYGTTLISLADYWKNDSFDPTLKVVCLFFNMLSRFVKTFLPRSKCLLISWLQSSSTVILEPKKTKSVTVSLISPPICHEVIGPDATNLAFFNLFLEGPFNHRQPWKPSPAAADSKEASLQDRGSGSWLDTGIN